jgi:hypothetical protein
VTHKAISVIEEVTKRADEHGEEGYRRFTARIGQSGSLRGTPSGPTGAVTARLG